MRRRYPFARSFRSRGSAPSELLSKWSPAITTVVAHSKMLKPCLKKLLCCGRGAAFSLTKGPRCRPANTNLHTIRARNAITARFGGDIQVPPSFKWTTASVRFSPRPTKSYAAARVVSVAASARLAACDGMNHQDFVLLARDFLEAFTGRHVKWLRAGLGFILGNHFVHFFHVGGCRIVFEKRCIAAR